MPLVVLVCPNANHGAELASILKAAEIAVMTTEDFVRAKRLLTELDSDATLICAMHGCPGEAAFLAWSEKRLPSMTVVELADVTRERTAANTALLVGLALAAVENSKRRPLAA